MQYNVFKGNRNRKKHIYKKGHALFQQPNKYTETFNRTTIKTKINHVRDNSILATSKCPQTPKDHSVTIVTYPPVTAETGPTSHPKSPCFPNDLCAGTVTMVTYQVPRVTHLVVTVEVSPVAHQQVDDSHMALLRRPMQGCHLQLKSQRPVLLHTPS